LPVIAAEASWNELRRHEPASKAGLALLTSALLEEGSDGRTAIQFATDIEDMGAHMSFDASGASLTALSQDGQRALGLMLAALDRPDFPDDAFEQMKDGQLATILNNEKDGTARARQALHRAIYGQNHYLGREAFGTRSTVEKLERADCVDFHRKVMAPDNLTIAIVGDFDSVEMEKFLTTLAGKSKARKAPPVPALPRIPAPRASKEYISIPGSAQLQFFMGHTGITRDHPDYHALLVMDHVLGTGPGFTDRLSARLRDREGLAYTVRAEICSSADRVPGVFACYIGTDAGNLTRVEQEFREEIDRLRKEAASAQEVADAKSYLLGSLPFKYDGLGALAEQLVTAERFGWKADHLDKFRKAVSEVTPEMVLEVARKHINPEKFHLVAAGPIDKKTGKPLK
jgi:zinc protease